MGLAVGDAVGTTAEFKPRNSFARVTDMVGGGPFNLAPGQWTDDTSMALCLATSLVEHGRFDLRDQIERYCRWYEDGYMSSTGRCFDIGSTVRTALVTYRASGDPTAGPTDGASAGNGCIMRLAPVPMFFFPDVDAAIEHSAQSCVTTHGATDCIDAARLLGVIIVRALAGRPKSDVLRAGRHLSLSSSRLRSIGDAGYTTSHESTISGSGYVVDCLEAALWSFARTDSFDEAIITAVNLGEDADTTAAVCGQIAGAFYGETGIPARWLERLAQVDEIRTLADRLRVAGPQERSAPAF